MKKFFYLALIAVAMSCSKQPEPLKTPTATGEIEWRTIDVASSKANELLQSATLQDWLRAKGYSGFSEQANFTLSQNMNVYTIPIIDQDQRDNVEITLTLYSSTNSQISIPILFEHTTTGTSHQMRVRGLVSNQVLKQFSWDDDGVEPGGFTDDPQWETPCPEQDYSFEDCFQCGCWDMQQDVVGFIAFNVAPIECMAGIALACAVGIIAPDADSMSVEEKIDWANDQISSNILTAYLITSDSKLIIN